MLDNQIAALKTILSDEDLQQYSGEGFWNLIQAVVLSDPFAGTVALNNIRELIFHIPTILFWDKMKRYLLGTFSCFEDQVRMAEKFNNDNNNYTAFVKKQIHLINEIDDDQKVDYFAALTRCFLLTQLEEGLFFKLSKFIITCTPNELQFLSSVPFTYQINNNAMVSSLYQYGLFTQEEVTDGAIYVLSDFAKALKQNSLNFSERLYGEHRIVSYEEISPLSIAEPMTFEDIANAINHEDVTIGGGNAVN